MYILIRWLISALTLMAIAYYLPGVIVSGFYAALVTAIILGLLNAIIKPIIVFFTLPINLLTLGLFAFVINALLFWFASTIVKGFEVSGFWPAFWGALIMTIVSWLINFLLRNN
jgi:putative membrane protein